MDIKYEKHFGRTPVRNAQFIDYNNDLKQKVGNGGLSDDILNKAQAVIEENRVDFVPMAQKFLSALREAINTAEEMGNHIESAPIITAMINPTMHLKANGGMFNYSLVSQIAARLIHFLEVIEDMDEDAIEVVKGFYTALRALVIGQVRGEGGKSGEELYNALNEACYRYFEQR
jgi:hypothetical protein